MSLSERYIETRFVLRVRANTNWVIEKLHFISNTGAPDRVLFLPDGCTEFVEVKSAKGRLSKKQKWMHERLRALGHTVHVIDSREAANELFDDLIDLYGE